MMHNQEEISTLYIMRKAKKDYFTRKFEKYRQDYSKTWNIISTELNGKNQVRQITKIEKKDLTVRTDPKKIADEINEYFANIEKQLAEMQMANSKQPPMTTTTPR
ncbi:hypothetical protein QE152_g15981 [Popillia japonica]|uniref:Uncharacterized protein n=1 Tax=Popillia japonica TaxID=7064 RepID=A0AAW1L6C6_POPJA